MKSALINAKGRERKGVEFPLGCMYKSGSHILQMPRLDSSIKVENSDAGPDG